MVSQEEMEEGKTFRWGLEEEDEEGGNSRVRHLVLSFSPPSPLALSKNVEEERKNCRQFFDKAFSSFFTLSSSSSSTLL